MKSIIIGTAGHVDHGKTTLVKALTGIDTDRLPEEKKRGMSIELGYAPLKISDDLVLGIVDVPGHESLVKTMVMGATQIDLALFVVAANEGIKPQTREHLQILSLLKVPNGMIVITKKDLVNDDEIQKVTCDIQKEFKGTFLEKAPMVSTSFGNIESLLTKVREFGEFWIKTQTYLKRKEEFLRIPIDRVFTLKGYGTVVTGPLLSGNLFQEDELEIYPKKTMASVRQIQAYGENVHSVSAPSRVALNLRNIKVEEVRKGNILGRPSELKTVQKVYAKIHFLKKIEKLSFLFHSGTFKTQVSLKKDKEDHYFIRFSEPQTLTPLDRFILRQEITIGGGEILDFVDNRFKNNQVVFKTVDNRPKNDQVVLKVMELVAIPFNSWEAKDAEGIQKETSLSPREFNEIVQHLIQEKKLLRLPKGFFLPYERELLLKEKLSSFFKEKPQMQVTDLKNLFSVSRKYAIPYLEFFDEKKWTLRKGDVRVPWKILEN